VVCLFGLYSICASIRNEFSPHTYHDVELSYNNSRYCVKDCDSFISQCVGKNEDGNCPTMHKFRLEIWKEVLLKS